MHFISVNYVSKKQQLNAPQVGLELASNDKENVHQERDHSVE